MAVTLTINGRTTGPIGNPTLFDCAQTLGVPVPTSCLKQGKCKECVVEVTEGMSALSERTISERHLRGNFRLSCQCSIVAAQGAVRCHTMRRGQMRIERHALGLPLSGEPLRLDPAVVREGDRILIDGIEIERSHGPIYGLAMDLGTTTVVLRLFNLETGEWIADASLENPQRFGGSDVMSRIQYDSDHPGKLLRRTLAGYLTHAIEELPVDPKTIYEMVVVGNSTMRDLFFRQSVYSIGQNPYRSITEIEMAGGKRASTALVETGRRCLLPIHPKARVYGAPVISGHVGADAAACMLAMDLAHEDRLVAIMDIGTNTELILGNRHRVLAASCPAGPAFEGGAISCGMPALDGAIEDVVLDDDGTCRLRVIGGGAPEGICGSGLIALLSELLRTGQMNDLGRFSADRERIVLDVPGDIFFQESDVNELAQAKGANVAGLHVVFSNYGLSFGEVDRFYLAGGFGRHLNVEAARRIGLIPDLPNSRVVQVGNAAMEGASMALLSRSRRRELEELVKRVEHCRLETHPDFFDFFVEGCQFKPVESLHQVEG
ncbi:MAG TPA: ASKHA domain-containing protein [Bryobacteraceae bacterium]|nr:ASKHA domain-containing protein [Bryobacteraceae bacterium]